MGYNKKITYIDKNGYEHYRDSDKLVHKHVAEKMLGRKLRPGEVVHHKNRNKLDNCMSNLWVFNSQQDHYNIHIPVCEHRDITLQQQYSCYKILMGL